ncbi:MAG: LptF/LptG family permease [Nitrospiraceae bacterium]|nr:LptF/LptG family permease [Nitrospiraceae bacterium]
MKIVQRLYLKDFLKLLFLLTTGLSGIFSLLDMIDKIGSFQPGRSSALDLALYASYNIPRFFLYLLPMSVLICSLFTFSQAFRRKEITAIKAAGGRLRRLFYPFIGMGVALSVLAFVTGEIVAPDFSKRAVDLRNTLEGKTKRINVTEGGLWLRCKDGNPAKIDVYDPEKRSAGGISIFIIGNDSLRQRISAEKANWKDGAWVLEKVTQYDFATGEITHLGALKFDALESPDFFSEELKSTGEMGIRELYRYTQRLNRAGFRNAKLAVDLDSKISFPLVSLFMMMLGISLSLRGSLGGGLFSAGLGLMISLVYWLSYTFSLSMGYAGVFPAFVSAWTIPSLFGALSVYLFLHIPE